jgi:putative transposase
VLHAPADAHYGLASEKTTEREAALAQARVKHAERFTTDSPIKPKILTTSDEASVNKPPWKTEVTLAT